MTPMFLSDRLQSGFLFFFTLYDVKRCTGTVLVQCQRFQTDNGNFMSAVKYTRARYFPLDPQQSQNTLNPAQYHSIVFYIIE